MALRFGAFTFDSQARELRRDGNVVPLSPKAFRLLELLVDARPRPVPREQLYRELWPDVIVEPGNLHGLVAEIRGAAREREIIRTVHRIGYAFVADAAVDDGPRYSILLGDEEIPLRGGENGIGRDPRDTVVIHASEVSRHHARLTVAGGVVTLEDLGSKNGTFLGTRRVTAPVEVHAGDDILIGALRLRLVRVDALATTV
jgi:DNA-binding winged helix-turn-helix (wHTH) protein